MKKLFLAVLIAMAAFLLQAEVLDRVVARVGSDIILLSDVQKQMMQMKNAGALPANMGAIDVLDQMIENRLIIQKAKDMGITVDNTRIKGMAERYISQIRSRFPSEAEYLSELRKMKLTPSDLLKYYMDLITENALSEQLIEKSITSKIFISDAEMRQFYQATKDTLAIKPISWEIGMIMREIAPSKETETEILNQMKALQRRLNAGEDFGAVARAYSDCPSKEAGGDLGYFGKGQMVEPFEKAAFDLSIGEVSEIVRTQFGYHLIKVEAKRGTEISARHILKILAPTQVDSLREMANMQAARDQYLAGKAFSELALEWSDDTESAQSGGIIGEFTSEELPELFSGVLRALPVGGITEVMSHEGMLYLFLKNRELPQRLYTFEEIKPQIKNYLLRGKQMQAYEEWISRLRNESYVEITLK